MARNRHLRRPRHPLTQELLHRQRRPGLRCRITSHDFSQPTPQPLPVDAATSSRREQLGLGLGFLGVFAFSVSLPATRVAVRDLGWVATSFGRAVLAALLALIAVTIRRVPRPTRTQRVTLLKVIAGVVIGFPMFTGLALRHAPAGHGAVVIGLLPAATAGWSVLRTGERPSRRYWAFAAVGVAAVIALSILRSTSTELAVGDLLLLGAVVSAAYGYGEGALLSREIGGWQTISWAVIGALPLTATLAVIGLLTGNSHGDVVFSKTALVAFVYLGAVSMYLGFFAWYAGLALGGVARVSQIQLLQPLLSLLWATWFLHESFDSALVVVAVVICIAVAGSRKSAIAAAPRP